MYITPTISKEQYDRLLKLAEVKESNFSIDRKQYSLSDSLNTFLKEHSHIKNSITKANLIYSTNGL